MQYLLLLCGPHCFKTGRYYGYVNNEICITADCDDSAISKVKDMFKSHQEFFKDCFGGFLSLSRNLDKDLYCEIYRISFSYGSFSEQLTGVYTGGSINE